MEEKEKKIIMIAGLKTINLLKFMIWLHLQSSSVLDYNFQQQMPSYKTENSVQNIRSKYLSKQVKNEQKISKQNNKRPHLGLKDTLFNQFLSNKNLQKNDMKIYNSTQVVRSSKQGKICKNKNNTNQQSNLGSARNISPLNDRQRSLSFRDREIKITPFDKISQQSKIQASPPREKKLNKQCLTERINFQRSNNSLKVNIDFLASNNEMDSKKCIENVQLIQKKIKQILLK